MKLEPERTLKQALGDAVAYASMLRAILLMLSNEAEQAGPVVSDAANGCAEFVGNLGEFLSNIDDKFA